MFGPPPGGIDPDQMVRMVVSREQLLALAVGARRLVAAPAAPEKDPREGLELSEQQYLVAPGESVRIQFTRNFNPGDLVQPVVERFVVSFPSGFETSKLTEGEFRQLLVERLGVPAERLPHILTYLLSNRLAVFWPHENQLRTVLRLPVRPTLTGPKNFPGSPLGVVAPEESEEVFL